MAVVRMYSYGRYPVRLGVFTTLRHPLRVGTQVLGAVLTREMRSLTT